jgi:hypothetical protein
MDTNFMIIWEQFSNSLEAVIPLTHSFMYLSVSRQVNSLFQTEFSKECDLELPPSTCSIFLFP